MNQLLTPNGGMPLELDDLRFLQDAYKDGFKAMLFELAKQNNGNMVLGGIEVTPDGSGGFNTSEGYVMLDYEVFYVPAAIGLNFNIIVIELFVYYDTDGNEIFSDSVSRDTYEVRQGRVYVPSNGNINPKNITVNDGNRLSNIITNNVISKGKDTLANTDVAGVRYDFVAGDFPSSGGYTPSPTNPPYAIKKHGRVHLYGAVVPPTSISFNSIAGADLILNIPVNFRKSSSTQQGNVFLCAIDDGVFKVGMSATQLIAVGMLTGTYSGKLDYDISLAGIAYDIDV